MTNQELLDSIEIGVSPLTNRIYIGIPDPKHKGHWKCKSDFTERLKKFVPQLFQEESNG